MRRIDYAAMTHRRCSMCREVKPVADFGRYNDPSAPLTGWRYYSRCRPCARSASREYGSGDRNRRNARLAAWRRSNPDAALANEQRKRIRAKYGISVADRDAIFAAQGHRCAICGDAHALVIDHDHITGVIRGGLCNPCNVRLGAIEAAPDTDEAIARLDPSRSHQIRRHLAADALLSLARGETP